MFRTKLTVDDVPASYCLMFQGVFTLVLVEKLTMLPVLRPTQLRDQPVPFLLKVLEVLFRLAPENPEQLKTCAFPLPPRNS
jgi:hypothetical protein